LAAEIEQRARSSEAWPAYLNDPSYAAAVTSWARCEAVCSLLWAYVAERDIEAGLTEVTSVDEDEQRSKGRTRRVSSGRRVYSALEMLRRWTVAANTARDKLGLSPVARAKLIKDDTISRTLAAHSALDQLAAEGRAVLARRAGELGLEVSAES
jgi:hypothetical protein